MFEKFVNWVLERIGMSGLSSSVGRVGFMAVRVLPIVFARVGSFVEYGGSVVLVLIVSLR